MDEALVRMLKSGSGDAKAYFEDERKRSYTHDFRSFMEQMIKEHKLNRKTIAVRAGMSQDYTYKLLRGDKHTDERDYILALCIACGMTLAQTQHALDCYGMQKLDCRDQRSHVLILAIESGKSILTIDEMLENAGFFPLKTSPDMKTAPIILIDEVPPEAAQSLTVVKHRYEKIAQEIGADHVGLAPMDFNYWGILTVQDENGNKYYVEAAYSCEGSTYYIDPDTGEEEIESTGVNLLVLDEENYQLSLKQMEREQQRAHEFNAALEEAKANGPLTKEERCELLRDMGLSESEMPEDLDDECVYSLKAHQMMREFHLKDEVTTLEQYDSIQDATKSPFFAFFLELDRLTDEKVAETMARIDDTRLTDEGIRGGAGIHGGHYVSYMECFNTHEPERREYLQIYQQDDQYTYSVSHESYFMRMELGELYKHYFGEKREPEYFVSVNSISDLTGPNARFRFIFNFMQKQMHEHLLGEGVPTMTSSDDLINEQIECKVNEAVALYQQDHYGESIAILEGVLPLIEKSKDRLLPMLSTYYKLAMTYWAMDDIDAAQPWWQKAYEWKDKTDSELLDEEDRETAKEIIAEAASYLLQIEMAHDCTDLELQKQYCQTTIEYLAEKASLVKHWICLFQTYGHYAYLLEESDLDKSIEMYKYGLAVARRRHLDEVPKTRMAVAVLYHNFGWVLWNLKSSEEAIIYYGRAIELLEDYLVMDDPRIDEYKATLAHVGTSLYNLYNDTGRKKEAEKLVAQLEAHNVKIPESEEE